MRWRILVVLSSLEELTGDFDELAWAAKLREARSLLEQANRLEPTNAEVLLYLAKVIDQLEEDPDQVRRILYRVQRLLDPPTNDVDRFHLAQATLLSAVVGDHVHLESLSSAREMFAWLGRREWERQCDDLLAAHGHEMHASWSRGLPVDEPQQGCGFQPIGQWHARMANGGTLKRSLGKGGRLNGVQSNETLGLEVRFHGQWHFDPANGILSPQGLVSGMSPFSLQIAIGETLAGGYAGIGSDGLHYHLTRGV